ncbi:MAG: hypothetical protein HGA53_11035, partial [Anaerolineaceae bacterium]|nr:hypothetical protein [Anaerolineaceae bacterium]
MADRQIFGEVVKDILNNLYDIAALETHPLLVSTFNIPDEYRLNRAEYARQLVLDTIEQIKPVRREENTASPEWRPYIILHRRYVDGINLQELAEQLSISPRQMRRDQHKAIEALTELLWVRQNPMVEPKVETTELEEADLEFEIHKEVIDLLGTTQGVCELLSKKCQEKGASFVFAPENRSLPVVTDRIVLRQILINLFNMAFQFAASAPIRLTAVDETDHLALVIEVPVGLQQEAVPLVDDHDRDSIVYWCNYIQAAI